MARKEKGENQKMYDVAIIGAGVIGAMTARALSRYDIKIALLEAGSDVATGASAANSGIVHAGHDAPEGSKKALFNVRGNRMMQQVARELGVKCGNNGSLVLGFSESEDAVLRDLLSRGKKNGVTDLEMLDAAAVRKIEPNVSRDVFSALYAKSGGIVCPYELTVAATGNAMDNGAELRLNFRVAAIVSGKNGFTIASDKGDKIEAKRVVNCAGIYADKVAGMIGDNSFKIGARKGEYILLDRESGSFVAQTLFTLPSEKGKGVLISPTVDGNILIGPTSVENSDREDNALDAEGFNYIKENAMRMCENIPFHNTITSFAGIRAFCDRHDFVIEPSNVDARFFHVAGIESPGLTASPAIAEHVSKIIADSLNARENAAFDPYRQPDYFFKELTRDEKNELIARDSAFGRILCRCEEITMGEVLHALRRNPQPRTVDAIKRRTRAGMGRCQGGFCQPYIVDILKEEYGLSDEEVMKSNGESYIFTGRTK